MAYVNVPKDLTKVKTKVLFNLTKRQLICFGSGALIGAPLFFLLKGSIGTSPAAMVMMVVMIPAMLFAMYEKNGQPLEVVLRHVVESRFHRPKRRIYETNNLYLLAIKQVNLNREVHAIVSPQTQADPRRTKANCRRHRTGQRRKTQTHCISHTSKAKEKTKILLHGHLKSQFISFAEAHIYCFINCR